MHKVPSLAVAFAIILGVAAEAPAQSQETMPVFKVAVVSRTTRAVSYRHRSGSTKVGFRGTDLMTGATGEARVESQKGALQIQADFAGLNRPTSFGTEYLTYVLWAVSPEGRVVNLGEVLVGDDHKSKLEVTSNLQAFALIVTAEPYYAVRRPSNLVVLENTVLPDTEGATEAVDAKYELTDRGGYIPTGYKFDPVILNATLPLEFFEARNALRIAASAGAERYAATSYAKAVKDMKAVDAQAISKKQDRKVLISLSREVVQTAEDAREIAVKHIETARADAERRAGARREVAATDRADAEASKRAAAEADANSAKGAASDAQAVAGDALLKQQAAEADSEASRAAAASSDAQLQVAINDREVLRANLLKQFNLILETRDTARGLVVNMSDVLFDTGKYTLRPVAREKLAKISGIVLAYPSLRLAIEGNTDSVGGEAYNQELSEHRAEGVRSYLTEQGVPAASSTAVGFGKTRPIASNDTSEGRQQNRRDELVVSGDVIGTSVVSLTLARLLPRAGSRSGAGVLTS
jgi:outer membrane protein OmpA-like peptidoglycan-associated protein